jgi:phospholipase C
MSGPLRRTLFLALLAVMALVAAACRTSTPSGSGGPTSAPSPNASPSSAAQPTRLEQAKDHLKHLVFIVQENRSFDHYFGTFPGAEGIPMRDGRPSVCVPDPILGRCVPPYRTTAQLQEGGPHAQRHSRVDVNRGRMDGFIRSVIDSPIHCADHRQDPACRAYLGPQGQPDVMSYHTARTIPNYWRYAREFVLQDHMFAPADSWTLPAHLFLISAWAAQCENPRDPMSCASDLELNDEAKIQRSHEDVPIWAWTDIT